MNNFPVEMNNFLVEFWMAPHPVDDLGLPLEAPSVDLKKSIGE